MRLSGRKRGCWLAGGLLLALAACSGSRLTEKPVDEQFGHRYEGLAPDRRETVTITPPDPTTEYFYYPAVVDSVHIRPAPFVEGVGAEVQQVPVDVLIKSSFPDACTELHEADVVQSGHIITVDLSVRRPKRAVCAGVVRPYRFYIMLEKPFARGDYVLKINDRVFAFEVKAVPSGGA